jgi:hypothetical protein
MSIHARKPATDRGTTFGSVILPDARHDRAPSTDGPASTRVEPIATSGDRQRAGDDSHTESSARRQHATVESPDRPWYHTERWLAVQLLALVPILSAMFAPSQFRIPLSIVGGTLVAIGTVMMLMHKPTGSLRDTGADSSSA